MIIVNLAYNLYEAKIDLELEEGISKQYKFELDLVEEVNVKQANINPNNIVCTPKPTFPIYRAPEYNQQTSTSPKIKRRSPGSRNNQLGAYKSINLKCLQPSRKLRKCGGRPLLSGHR